MSALRPLLVVLLAAACRRAVHEPPRFLELARGLKAFGAPLHDLREADLVQPGLIFQIGVPPVRIDVLTAIDAVTFDEAWPERLKARFAELEVPVLSRRHLIANKRAAGRLQDLADVERLEGSAAQPRSKR